MAAPQVRRNGRGKPPPGTWSQLTKGTRDRYKRAGITRQDYYKGVSLKAARGHADKPPDNAAPVSVTRAAIEGEITLPELRDLERWAEAFTSSWIPEHFSNDLKAALSQLSLPPEKWERVRFTPAGEDAPWQMIITPANVRKNPDGSSPYDVVIDIPGGGG